MKNKVKKSLAQYAQDLLMPAQVDPENKAVAPLHIVTVTNEERPAELEAAAEDFTKMWRTIGYDGARQTKSFKADQSVLGPLEARAGLSAANDTPPAYDPQQYLIDRRVESVISSLDEDLIEEKDNLRMASAQLREREEERAALGADPVYPSLPAWLRGSSVACLAISLAPAVHDLLGGLPAPLKWMLAIGFSAGFGLFLVAAILPSDEQAKSEEPKKEDM